MTSGNLDQAPSTATSSDQVGKIWIDKRSDFWLRFTSAIRGRMVFVFLIVFLAIGSIISDVFLTPANLLNILWATSVLGIVALGQTLLIITCNFDLSVSTVVPFAGIVTVGLQIAGWGLWPSVIAGLFAGILVGLLNGLIVVITGAYPFLITLGTQTLVYSVSLILTRSQTWFATIPAFNNLGRGQVFGFLHYSVIIFLGLALFLEFVLNKTPFGRSLFVLGLNEEVGRLSGLLVNRIKIATFTFCGFTAGLAGLIMTSRLNSTSASGAQGMEFDSIIATVLGGTSLFGGSGGTLRTVVGVIVLGILNNLVVLLGVSYEGQFITKGAVFLLVVWLDTITRKR
jgi:ribose transport system permease protein